ncbi:hypothetical protein VE23_15670 [Paenibacillus sp. D9]|uniref:hypothetical protein n=1 Tax=Paenibacillus sp. D9 TaxID=665792 RepID=UPI00061F484A|nr:hypothetical protein [Paenibacillus sp. D9]KKC48197.1 hypothetical protein VE23_15670 [Paenibacillus sp. D9]
MPAILSPIVISLLFLLMLRSQLKTRLLSARLFVLPMLLGGALAASSGTEAGEGEGILLLLEALMGIGIGLLQGHLSLIFQEGSVWVIRGSVAGAAVWLFSIPLRLGIELGAASAFGIPMELSHELPFVPYLLGIGGIFLGRALLVALRYPRQMAHQSI